MKTTVWMAIILCCVFVIPLFFIALEAIIDWNNSLLKKWFLILENDIDIR